MQLALAPFAPSDDWREVLGIIKHMRRVGGAPVDTMGCEKISEDAASDDKGRRFVTLAGLGCTSCMQLTHSLKASGFSLKAPGFSLKAPGFNN
jgi:hypothetical protein